MLCYYIHTTGYRHLSNALPAIRILSLSRTRAQILRRMHLYVTMGRGEGLACPVLTVGDHHQIQAVA